MKVNRRPKLDHLSISEDKSSIDIVVYGQRLIVRFIYDDIAILDEVVSFDTLRQALLTLPIQP